MKPLKQLPIFLKFKENKKWFDLIWHHQKQQKIKKNLYKVDFKLAIKASMLLFLNKWYLEDKLDDGVYLTDLPEVAWKNEGTYYTDYGIGESFCVLCIYKNQLIEYTDGTL